MVATIIGRSWLTGPMLPSMKNIAKPFPIIVCGKAPPVAIGVKEGIRPAYEAIHVITSVEAGVRDIPLLLQGQPPQFKEQANLGTQEYGKKPAAVVAGGGYNDADFEQLRNACKGESNVPWLRHDVSKDIDPRQPRPKIGIEYGEQIAEKIVGCLKGLEKDGKMHADGVYYF